MPIYLCVTYIILHKISPYANLMQLVQGILAEHFNTSNRMYSIKLIFYEVIDVLQLLAIQKIGLLPAS